jgi:hypothetical protein
MVMDYRPNMDMNEYWGCSIFFLSIFAESAEKVPYFIRTHLPGCRSKEFATWKAGQGLHALSNTTLNTWTRAFDLENIVFNGAAADMHLSQVMCN